MTSEDSVKVNLSAALWNGKWLIVFTTGVFAILSVFIALSLPNIYRADALLAPMSSDNSNQGLASLAGQFGGLASMAGISLGGSQTDKTVLAIESLRSRSFLMSFIEKHQLKVPLMAAKGWDSKRNELLLDADLYDVNTSTWVRVVEPPKQAEPSLWEAYDALMEVLIIERDKDNGLLKLSIEHYSPYIASQWANLLVQDINLYMRHKDSEEARKSINYLREQTEITDVLGMQTVLYQLIEEQMKTVMLAEVREEYAFAYVDPPMVPEMKYKPRRAIICIIGTFFGGFLACVVVLLNAFRRAE